MLLYHQEIGKENKPTQQVVDLNACVCLYLAVDQLTILPTKLTCVAAIEQVANLS